MANKTIPALPDYGSQDSDKIRKDLLEITKNDGTYASPSYPTGATRKITVEDLKTALAIISQTVTNGVTTKSPSEDAVFDAIYAKGLVKSNAWKNNGVGTFTLEADKYNIVNYSNTNIEILLPAVEVDKTIIVQGTTQDGSGAVNFTINNIKIGGADLGTPYSITVTNEKEVLIFYGNYYGWHLIGHSNKTIDLSTKLDLDGGNANQDIDIDGFGVNAKHFKVNGTAGAGHIGLKHQSASITASASESSIGADSVGDPVWKNDGGAIDKLELQSNKTSTVTGNEASTSKYLTVKGLYDWAVGLFAPKASPTFTGTVTTPDVIVSSATGSTPAFFDSAKKLITTTAQLWGTWVQTWASKATPVDADTIGFHNSASTFVGVKSTLLNFWTTYLLPKIQALSYVSGSISSGFIPYFNGSSLANSNIRHNNLTHSTIIVGSASYIQALSVYDNTGIIPLLSISNDATSATFRANGLTISSADNSKSIIIEPKGISGYSYKPAISVGTDSTNNQSTYTAYHFPTSTYTLVSNSAGQLMLFAINNTVGTLINAIHNKTGVQQGAWYNGGLLVGSGTKLASAVLQADSTTQGFLPPRMTNTQRTNIVSPAVGLMVYCTDATEGLYIYKSTGWTFII